jgi:3-hydroxyacyl-CoA dehydrogenase
VTLSGKIMHEGSIAVLALEHSADQLVRRQVRNDLAEAIMQAIADETVRGVVISIRGDTFGDGAEADDEALAISAEANARLVDAIGRATKPVVAALDGAVLDADLEVALACHARIASAQSRLGFPAVKMGLMPGARGTQLLPRLVGARSALTLLALGEPLSAEDAKALNLVGAIAKGDLVARACVAARELAGASLRRTSALAPAVVEPAAFDEFASRHARKFRGLDAPPAIIAAVRAASELPFDLGAQFERESFQRLLGGPQHNALRYATAAERMASEVPALHDAVPRPVSQAGIVGSGTMGSGIAIALLCAGIPVTLYERDPAALERGTEHIRKTIDANGASGKMRREHVEKALADLSPVSDIGRLGHVDLVIEAAYETMAVKHDVFSALDAIVRPGAILATNTSYLDIDEIAAITRRPGDVVGLHFFSPANIMKLLEVVRGKATSTDVIATAFELARRIGKVPVLSGNGWGFIGNRMLAVRRQQAEAMAVEGASPAQIDAVIEKFGMAMGPFRVGDLAGLDLGWNAETSTGSTIRERLCEAGRRGQKSGAGFYDYDDNRRAIPSEETLGIIAGFARDKGIAQRSFTDVEVLDRLLWPMVDEGAKILAEGIALRESDIDVVWLNGYGWPAWTGGPMFHARQTALHEVVRRLEAMGLAPSDAIRSLADNRSKQSDC